MSKPKLLSRWYHLLSVIMAAFGTAFLFAENETPNDHFYIDFAEQPAGAITECSLPGVVLAAETGHAEILAPPNNRATRMLRITGGDEKSVVLRFEQPVTAGFLWLDLERWTGRSPFLCQIEIETNAQWQEVRRLDETTQTGNQAPLRIDWEKDMPVSALRFQVTSPEGSGMLVKKLYLGTLHAARLIGFETKNFETLKTPILLSEQNGTIVQKIDFLLFGDKLPANIQVQTELQNTEILDSAAIMINGRTHPVSLTKGISTLEIPMQFEPGRQTIALVLQPKSNTRLNETASGGITNLEFAGQKLGFDNALHQWPVGHLLVAPGRMGVHTFRIPGLVKSKQGTLLAVYDFRYKHSGDLPADIDVGLSRSTDGGQTWETPRVIMNFDTGNPKEGVGDPAILVDEKTGRVWVAALWAHNGHSLATSKSGLEFGESGQFVLCYSDDDGLTWSKPRNITPEIGQGKDWRIVFNGPGCGITMRDGTLVFAAQFWDAKGIPYSTILFSKDQGATWHISTGARSHTTEAQVVELADGSLMLNMRDNRGGSRAVAVTKDLGQTWTEHPTSRLALPESVCQASLIRVTPPDETAAKNVLAFLNPHVQKGRYDMTIQLSEDDGKSWSRKLNVYSPNCYGYSSMTMLDVETIGVLYETQGGLIFQHVRLADIPIH